MSQGPLCPNLSQKVQAEVSQMANRNLSRVILLGGLSVNLNHLKSTVSKKICVCGRDFFYFSTQISHPHNRLLIYLLKVLPCFSQLMNAECIEAQVKDMVRFIYD